MNINSILFLGTPNFAIPTLKSLHEAFPQCKTTVITRPDKIRGRGRKSSPSPVKILAQALKLEIHTPHTKPELVEIITKMNPDIIVLVAYGMLIPKTITDNYFCINIHASLLPKYRGPSPIQTALLNQDKITGVTLMKINENMDSGDILFKKELPILPSDNHGTLHDKLAILGAESLTSYLKDLFQGEAPSPIKQNHKNAVYCNKIEKTDLFLDKNETFQTILAKIKAFSPSPGAYTTQNNKRIKILDAKLDKGTLILLQVQPEGKKPMSYHDYCQGNPEGIDLC